MITLRCAVFICLAQLVASTTPPCDSEIYCHGQLLHTVQMSKIFQDSKTFVDMKLRYNANTTLENFKDFMSNHNQHPSRDAVIRFVNESFEPAGREFEDWIPQDWTPSPKFVRSIQDPEYKTFALTLNKVWKELGRKMREDVKENQDLYSIIWVPNPVIVPGGRFREFYYWDSYWIIQGLLLSEMHTTVKGMLTNFAYIVDTYGHIPNGGRIYYLERSQPPLFIPMVKLYVDSTGDKDFVAERMGTFEKEFSYWMDNHAVKVEKDGKNYTLYRYADTSMGPRPESYSEDVESSAIFKEEKEKEAFYSEIKAAAESGWDFSSRWFILNGTNKGNLTNIKTRSIIPVDLNAMLYQNAMILAEWHEELGNISQSSYYRTIAHTIMEAVEAVLWHEEVGSWLDYDILNGVKRDWWYPTNISPLWTGCYDKSNTDKIVRLVRKYLDNSNVIYPGGVPMSQEHTGEQWDFPNVWPPIQHMMIVGLNNTGDEAAQRLAYELAERWVRSNHKAFMETEAMFEKYDATVFGGHGGGGEYEVQLGFGWSNGVILDLLYRYGDQLSSTEDETTEATENVEEIIIVENIIDQTTLPSKSSTNMGSVVMSFIALVVTVVAGYIG
ncbi:trehalase-like isoform X2 [Atheta coriaria]